MKRFIATMLAVMMVISMMPISVYAENTIEPTTTPVVTVEPTVEATAKPTSEASVEPTAESIPEVNAEPASEVTVSPTAEASADPSVEPTAEASADPVAEPTEEPVAVPIEEPAVEPTEEPVVEPTEEPVAESTEEPTEEPAEEPAEEPTEGPSEVPAEEPAEKPTEEPAEEPSEESTKEPIGEPVVEDVSITMSEVLMLFAARAASMIEFSDLSSSSVLYANQEYTVNWKAVTGASKYLISVRNFDLDGESGTPSVFRVAVEGATSYTISKDIMTPGSQIKIWVGAYDINDTEICQNTVTVTTAKLDFRNIETGDTIPADQACNVQWEAVKGASEYLISVRNFTLDGSTNTPSINRVSTGTKTSYNIPATVLTADSKLRIWVGAHDAYGTLICQENIEVQTQEAAGQVTTLDANVKSTSATLFGEYSGDTTKVLDHGFILYGSFEDEGRISLGKMQDNAFEYKLTDCDDNTSGRYYAWVELSSGVIWGDTVSFDIPCLHDDLKEDLETGELTLSRVYYDEFLDEDCEDYGSEEYHTSTNRRYYLEAYCSDCSERLEDEDYILTETEPTLQIHEYEDGVCVCGRVNPYEQCEHPEEEYVYVWYDVYHVRYDEDWTLVDCENTSDDYFHTSYYEGTAYGEVRCGICDEWIDEVSKESELLEKEYHEYNNGKCVLCGHICNKLCSHDNLINHPHGEIICSEYKVVDFRYHYLVEYNIIDPIYECRDCGYYIQSSNADWPDFSDPDYLNGIDYKVTDDPINWVVEGNIADHVGYSNTLQEHDYRNEICTDCGYELIPEENHDIEISIPYEIGLGIVNLGAQIDPAGIWISRGFHYGLTEACELGTVDGKMDSDDTVIYAILEGLTPGETYYFKAYSTFEYGTFYSEVVSITLSESACDHAAGNYEYVLDTSVPVQYVDTGDGVNHYLINSYSCICKDCGGFVSTVTDEYLNAATEAHTFDANGACACGYVKIPDKLGAIYLNVKQDDLVIEENFTFTWNEIADANHYLFSLRDITESNEGPLLYEREHIEGGSGNSLSANLTAGRRYRAWICAVPEGMDHTSPQSSVYQAEFDYRIVPDFDVSDFDGNGQPGTSGTLKWTVPTSKNGIVVTPDNYVIYVNHSDANGTKQVYDAVVDGSTTSLLIDGSVAFTEYGLYTITVYATMYESWDGPFHAVADLTPAYKIAVPDESKVTASGIMLYGNHQRNNIPVYTGTYTFWAAGNDATTEIFADNNVSMKREGEYNGNPRFVLENVRVSEGIKTYKFHTSNGSSNGIKIYGVTKYDAPKTKYVIEDGAALRYMPEMSSSVIGSLEFAAEVKAYGEIDVSSSEGYEYISYNGAYYFVDKAKVGDKPNMETIVTMNGNVEDFWMYLPENEQSTTIYIQATNVAPLNSLRVRYASGNKDLLNIVGGSNTPINGKYILAGEMNLNSEIDGTHTFNISVDGTSMTKRIYFVEKKNPEIVYLSQNVTARTLPGTGEVVANLLMNTQIKKLGICANQALVEWDGRQCFIPESAITEEFITPEMEYVNDLLANNRNNLNIWLNNVEENFQSRYNGYLLLEQTLDEQWFDPAIYNYTATAYDGAMSAWAAIAKWLVGDKIGAVSGAVGETIDWTVGQENTDIERLLSEAYVGYINGIINKETNPIDAFVAEMTLRMNLYRALSDNPDLVQVVGLDIPAGKSLYDWIVTDMDSTKLYEYAGKVCDYGESLSSTVIESVIDSYKHWTTSKRETVIATSNDISGAAFGTVSLALDIMNYAKEKGVADQYWTAIYSYMASVNDGFLDMLDSYIAVFREWSNQQKKLDEALYYSSAKYLNKLIAYRNEFAEMYKAKLRNEMDKTIDQLKANKIATDTISAEKDMIFSTGGLLGCGLNIVSKYLTTNAQNVIKALGGSMSVKQMLSSLTIDIAKDAIDAGIQAVVKIDDKNKHITNMGYCRDLKLALAENIWDAIDEYEDEPSHELALEIIAGLQYMRQLKYKGEELSLGLIKLIVDTTSVVQKSLRNVGLSSCWVYDGEKWNTLVTVASDGASYIEILSELVTDFGAENVILTNPLFYVAPAGDSFLTTHCGENYQLAHEYGSIFELDQINMIKAEEVLMILNGKAVNAVSGSMLDRFLQVYDEAKNDPDSFDWWVSYVEDISFSRIESLDIP